MSAWTERTHCKNGHEYTPDNIGRHAIKGRECVACRRDRQAKYMRRKRAARRGE